MTLDKPYRVSVCVQTHWDREWYFPQQTFVARLLAVMERVCDQLDAGTLTQFLFDGQVAALDDLIAEAEPALTARVLAHAKAGRIVLGPWYVMADEFLVSGESLWRNLELGMQLSREHGNCQAIGYLPDSFGHVAQMPQLLRAHGITRAVTWRGIDLRHAEFRWRAPDGSSVDALYLTQGYYQLPLNLPAFETPLTKYLEAIAPRSRSGKLLLTQGGDHLVSSAKLPERIAAFNASQQRYELVQEGLAEHFHAVGSFEGTPVLEGELRANAQSFVLPDVLSTRRHLKDAHQRLEDRLLGETEPLWAWLNVEPPAHALRETWKRLLVNQAHDSICGCSVDEVHTEMKSRFAQLDQRLHALRARALHAVGMQSPLQHEGEGASIFADHHAFTLFNPLPQARTGWQAVELFLQGPTPEALRVLDLEGTPLPLVWLDALPARELRSPLDDFPEPVIGHRHRLRVRVPLQGLEALALRVEACASTAAGAATAGEHLPTASVIKAGCNRLEVDAQGQLFWHTPNGRLQLLLHTELDAGDTYNFAPAPRDAARQWHSAFMLGAVQRNGPYTQVELSMHYEQPQGLDDARQGPSAHRVGSQLRLNLLLQDDAPWVEAELLQVDAAQDHRTRLVLASGETLTETAADSAFHWTRRPAVLASYPAAPTPQRETPVVVNPSLSAVQAGGIAVTHRGLQEFEVVRMPDPLQAGTHGLALTLQRAVGWLSRRDLITRGAGAGPDLATPDAQRNAGFTTPLAFALDPSLTADAILQAALQRRRPLLVLTGHAEPAWREPATLPPQLVTSCVRRVDGELELRAWNPLDGAVEAPLPGWSRVGGDTVQPHQIATWRRPA